MKFTDYISNGMGGPSMYLLWLACQGEIPARISITADTGSEWDCLISDGSRMSAKDFFNEVVAPMGERYGVEARFVRARDKQGEELPPLHVHTADLIKKGKPNHVKIPVFGSGGGRLRQACTERWKIRAINQCLRRDFRSRKARAFIGLHADEVLRRGKGDHVGRIDGFETFQSFERNKKGAAGEIIPVYSKWRHHCYPVGLDRPMARKDINDRMSKSGIRYIIGSQCNMCPHMDRARWLRQSKAANNTAAKLEEMFDGEFFLTNEKRPLLDVIEAWESQGELFPDGTDFGCGNLVCGL